MNDAVLVSRKLIWFRHAPQFRLAAALLLALCGGQSAASGPLGPEAVQQAIKPITTERIAAECLAVERAFAANRVTELKQLKLETPRWQALQAFRLAAIYIPLDDKPSARAAVRRGLAAVKIGLETQEKSGPSPSKSSVKADTEAENEAELLLLGAMLDGQFLLIDRYRLLHNGFRGLRRLRKAERLSPNNNRAHLVRGTAKVVAPWALGGSAEEAIEIFSKANLNQPLCAQGQWAQVDILNWLGRAHAKLNHSEAALEAYQQALARSPDNHWVKLALAGQGYEWTEHGEEEPAPH